MADDLRAQSAEPVDAPRGEYVRVRPECSLAWCGNPQECCAASRIQRRSGRVLRFLPKSAAGPASTREEDGVAAAGRTVLRRCACMSTQPLRSQALRYAL